MIMKRFVLVLAATLSMGATAFAASGSLRVDASIMNSISKFKAEGNEYYMVSHEGTMLTQITGSGDFSGVNQVSQEVLKMPNRSAGEYIKASIERTEEGVANLNMQANLSSELGQYTQSYSLEIKLIEGTWSDFDAGKEVKAKLTRRGVRQSQEVQEETADRLAQMMRNGLENQGLRVGSSTVDIETSHSDVLTLSKEQIVQPNAYQKIKIKFSVRN